MKHTEWSFYKDRPIVTPDLLPYKITCRPMSKEWKETISSKFWATNFSGALEDQVPSATVASRKTRAQAVENLKLILKLRDRLLTFGGEEACLPPVEEDIHWLLNSGEAWLPQNIKIIQGTLGRCHENAALLWDANRGDLKLATGYYLTDDGMWRQHSWCLQKNSRGGRVVETTNLGLLYFGYIKTDQQSEETLLWY